MLTTVSNMFKTTDYRLKETRNAHDGGSHFHQRYVGVGKHKIQHQRSDGQTVHQHTAETKSVVAQVTSPLKTPNERHRQGEEYMVEQLFEKIPPCKRQVDHVDAQRLYGAGFGLLCTATSHAAHTQHTTPSLDIKPWCNIKPATCHMNHTCVSETSPVFEQTKTLRCYGLCWKAHGNRSV